MDFISLILTLQPIEDPSNGSQAPFWWGRAAQSFFLELLGRDQPEWAARLHDENGPHPYTVSSLQGSFAQGKLDLQHTYILRLTAFEPALVDLLHCSTLPGGRLAQGEAVSLDRRPFRIADVTDDPDAQPWAGRGDYASLAATRLARPEPPARRIGLQFTSPVSFRQNGRDVPLPLPELVFGSLLDRWNAYSPVAFSPDVRRYAAECLLISRYELKTRSVPVKDNAQRIGMVGQITYSTINYDRYWLSVLHVLAAFSKYCGLGAATGHGMGQCRVVAEEAEE